MKRNCQGTHDTVRFNSQKLVPIDCNTKLILDHVIEIKQDIRRFNFHIKMDMIDMSLYFPLENDASLAEFMAKDEDWEKRRKGFHHLLYTVVTNDKKKFSGALLHTLFTRDFVRNHKWPIPGYL